MGFDTAPEWLGLGLARPSARWGGFALCAILSGCFRFELTTDVAVTCTSGGDCPSDRACFDGRCLPTTTACLDVDPVTRDARAAADGNACGSDGRVCVQAVCALPRCGDGVRTSPETCDGDPGCRADCTFCGDGEVQSEEQCDDGKKNSDTMAGACRATCVESRCGDGVVDPGEGCDEGKANSDTDSGSCRSDCKGFSCGDGVLDPREVCDDGAANSDIRADACRTTCVPATCGDGVRDASEECDSGASNSDVRPNACRKDCRLARCGDGTDDLGESCDDGVLNANDIADACRTSCVRAHCGDGVMDTGEVCDHGRQNSDTRKNACRTDCRWSWCGDGVLDDNETCDDGNANSDIRPNACRLSCERATCGDATLDLGEQCDTGTLNNDAVADACRTDCRTSRCGDGTLDTGELCDSGLANADRVADACRTTCRPARCGDGTVDTGEECDDALANSDVIPGRCRLSCVKPRCGDGTVDLDESCDDGPANSDVVPGSCRTSCSLSSCGDGVVDDGEECDDGDKNSDEEPNACRTRCVAALCGDGVIDDEETCDEGDANSDTQSDACRTDCQPARCGDGTRDLGEQCDEGTLNASDVADACRLDCSLPRCGDGAVDSDEACDDNNTVSGDGCNASCQKREQCGDRVQDQGEACDDGNDNPMDGCDACHTQVFRAELIVSGDVEQGTAAERGLTFPMDVEVDAQGRVIFADSGNDAIRRIELDGRLSTLAGIGLTTGASDGQRAATAGLNDPFGLALDGVGRIVVPENKGSYIRMVERDGTIRTMGGNGTFTVGAEGVDARLTGIPGPVGVAIDGLGRIYLADASEERVRRIKLDGTIETLAGKANVRGYAGDGGPARDASLHDPYHITVDADGRVLFTEMKNHVVRAIEANGTIRTLAGQGALAGFAGDNGPATGALLNGPGGIAVDDRGGFFISDSNNHRIRYVDALGTITTVAGTGTRMFNGEGPDPLATNLSFPAGLALDALGRLYIADQGHGRIRRIETDGTIRTLAGNGFEGFGQGGRHALETTMRVPSGLAVGRDGSVFIAEQLNGLVFLLRLDGTLEHVAGAPGGGIDGSFAGDGGPARNATFTRIRGLAVDDSGRLIIADPEANRVRRVDLDGIVRTIAGTGTAGFDGDGVALAHHLQLPRKVLALPGGALLISDAGNHRIRRLELDGNITTIVGTSTSTFNGDGLPATETTINLPGGLALDPEQRLVFVDAGNRRVRRVEHDGTVVTVAGTGDMGDTGDSGPATAATFMSPLEVAFDPAGNLYVSDFGATTNPLLGHRVRRIAPDGTIYAHAGSGGAPATTALVGVALPDADGGPAWNSRLNQPSALVWSPAFGLVWTEQGSNTVRRMNADGRVQTVVGFIHPAVSGRDGAAALLDARSVSTSAGRTFVAGGRAGRVYEYDGVSRSVRIVAGFSASLRPAGAPAAAFHPFGEVTGVAFDGVDRLYVSDRREGVVWRVEMLAPTDPKSWTIEALPHDVVAPSALQLTDVDTLLVADAGAHCVRTLTLSSGAQATLAGTCGVQGFRDGPQSEALFSEPTHMLRTDDGTLYVSDRGNNRVRLVFSGTVSTVLGTGASSSTGEGTPARSLPVNRPGALALDAWGNLFVASSDAVREVANVDGDARADGDDRVITIFPSPSTAGPSGEVAALDARCIETVRMNGPDDIFVVDSCRGAAFTLVRSVP